MKIIFKNDVSGFVKGEADVHPDIAARYLASQEAHLPEEESKTETVNSESGIPQENTDPNIGGN